MVEIDLLKAVAPPIQLSPGDRTKARVSLEAVVTGRRPPATKRAARRRRIVRAGSVAALAVSLAVGTVVLPGRRRGSSGPMLASAQALVLPDGTVLDRTRITKYILAGRTAELRKLLGTFGIRVEVRRHPVHPDAPKGLTGWEFYPADPEAAAAEPFDHTWEVDDSDAGSLLKIRIGRVPFPGETYSTAGLSVYQIHPELCGAVVGDDPAQTHRNLLELGFDVQWSLLPSSPDAPGYNAANVSVESQPPSSGDIYAMLQGNQFGNATNSAKVITIEVVPENAERRGASSRTLYC